MNAPIADIIRQRYSCRRFDGRPLDAETQRSLRDFLATLTVGPFGTPARFVLAAASAGDREELKGLGTYGFIRGAAGYIIGAVERGPRDMEDFGYLMEQAVLAATAAGLGTCWLGGSFTKSSFAGRIAAASGETVPAVAAVGHAVSAMSASHRRLPAEQLFFHGRSGRPLAAAEAGPYALPLEMVRLAPSASNKQPWRIIRDGDAWHFYLARTKGYGKGSLIFRLLDLADLQRVDLGIAMCHFALAAGELGLSGRWSGEDPGIAGPEAAEYIVSWLAG